MITISAFRSPLGSLVLSFPLLPAAPRLRMLLLLSLGLLSMRLPLLLSLRLLSFWSVTLLSILLLSMLLLLFLMLSILLLPLLLLTFLILSQLLLSLLFLSFLWSSLLFSSLFQMASNLRPLLILRLSLLPQFASLLRRARPIALYAPSSALFPMPGPVPVLPVLLELPVGYALVVPLMPVPVTVSVGDSPTRIHIIVEVRDAAVIGPSPVVVM